MADKRLRDSGNPPVNEPVDRTADGLWDGCHDDRISPGDAHAVAAGWGNTTQLSNALDAAAFEIERLRGALERLASSEGFVGAGVLDKTFSGRECRARMRYAEEALNATS